MFAVKIIITIITGAIFPYITNLSSLLCFGLVLIHNIPKTQIVSISIKTNTALLAVTAGIKMATVENYIQL